MFIVLEAAGAGAGRTRERHLELDSSWDDQTGKSLRVSLALALCVKNLQKVSVRFTWSSKTEGGAEWDSARAGW